MKNKILDNYFLLLFSIIPLTIIIGPAISLGTILLIDFSFILFLVYKNEYKFFLNKTVKLILLLCLYLIFNSLIAKDFSISAFRNLGFIRFGILFLAFNYFFLNSNFYKKILVIWTLTLFILVVDVYIESFMGRNILGYGELYGSRIVSFFKDEPVVGGYINAFYLIIIGYLFNLSKDCSKNLKYVILMISVLFILAIFLTGERSNTIKAFIGFFIFFIINDHFKLKQKIFSIFLFFILIAILFNESEYLKTRYISQFLKPVIEQIQSKDKSEIFDKEKNIYAGLYRSGFTVFKNYPLFGVGNKNYRIETCINKVSGDYYCNTHPHQTYFEFLAEHGLLGSAVLLFIFFNLIFGKLKNILDTKNYIQIGCFIFLMNSFIPLLPSGAFFGDYALTLFWLNLSLMYSVEKKTNVYSSD
tara:strand:+ start:741 stop:1988 length:1248 start_codon:yes stop_codon:yes gene_type:complete